MYKKLASATIALALFLSPLSVSASTTSDLQAQINSLLAQIKALQVQVGGSSSSNTGTGSSCLSLVYNLYADQTDATTNGEVSKLQKFLGGQVTGYFGPMTQQLVQNWQSAHGVVSSGSPDTTGYGYVGPKTRSAMSCSTQTGIVPSVTLPTKSTLTRGQLKIVSPTSGITVSVGATVTITYDVGTNIVSSDSAIIERTIINADSGTTNSTYVPVSQSGGRYSFEWVPSQSGEYKAKLTINHNNKTYTVKSGTITAVGDSISASDLLTPTLSVSLSPSSVDAGESSLLKWSSKNATKCLLQYNVPGQLATEEYLSVSGSKTVTPSQTTTYYVSCSNEPGDGKDGPTAFKNVTLSVSQVDAPTCTLTPSSDEEDTAYMDLINTDEFYIKPYGSVTLTWTSEDATYVDAMGDKGDTDGSVTLDNLTDAVNNYSVTAHGYGGTATCSTVVYVNWKG
jgi:peptidoglycan hydrolase-like protein with peptidoglycan-binding domain